MIFIYVFVFYFVLLNEKDRDFLFNSDFEDRKLNRI
jgi:hypothetical protein